jgi:hypothetical protein
MAHIAGLFGREVEAMRWRTKADITAFDRFPRPSQPKTLEFLYGMAIPRYDDGFLHIRAWGCGRTCFTCRVWLITDSENISKALIKKHGPAIHCLDSMRTSTDVGVHVGVDSKDRQRLSEKVVVDILV